MTNKFDNIPEELKQLDRWVCWRIEERDGKDTKIPINPSTGGQAMSNNPTTWGTYQQASKAAKQGRIKDISVSGIGFMFNGDGVLGVDLDNARDSQSGQIELWAKDIINELDSYTEISQSGKGVHIICYGKLPPGKRRKERVEMYSTGRYFIMTGNILDEGHGDIEERTEQLTIVHNKYLEDKRPEKRKEYKSTPLSLDTQEIIQKASDSKNGSRFRQLMAGDIAGNNNDDSAADLALCNLLAFWTGRDSGLMDQIFRQSGLFRPKWDEMRGNQTYGQKTIDEAISKCNEVYSPGLQQEYKTEAKQVPTVPPTVQAKPDFSTDIGRSKMFSDEHKNVLRWCPDMRTWFWWNGKYWERDQMIKVIQLAKKTVTRIVSLAASELTNAVGEEDVKEAKTRFKEATKSKFERAIKSMIELSKDELPIYPSQFDNDYYSLNCQNGIIDLRTGELSPHDPKKYCTKIANANYNPKKKFEKFGLFMKDITCGDAELAKYFKQISGMAAVGKVFYEGMAMFHGKGRNGKSTFVNTLIRVLGTYGGNIKPELLMYHRDGKEPVGLAEVMGKRLVAAIETEEGKRLSASMLKQLASTDPITARKLYENPVTFIPTHTLILATNFLPKVGSIDDGTWRRIAVVPFKAKFEEKKEVKDYAGVLFYSDGDAILSWIVEGAREYIANGHNVQIPKAVEEATREYRSAENWLDNFIREKCDVGNYEESSQRLYDAYKNWCDKNNQWCRPQNDFSSALEMSGYTKKRNMYGIIWWGLRLNTQEDDCIPTYSGWRRYQSRKPCEETEKNDKKEPIQERFTM